MSEVVVAPPVNRTARSRAATRQLWLDRLAPFPASGLTVAQFCASEAVSLPSYYFWKRRLADEAQAPTTQDQGGDRGPRLLPVKLQPAIRRCCIAWWGRESTWGLICLCICVKCCQVCLRWGTSRRAKRCRSGCRIDGGCSGVGHLRTSRH